MVSFEDGKIYLGFLELFLQMSLIKLYQHIFLEYQKLEGQMIYFQTTLVIKYYFISAFFCLAS